MTIIHVSPDMTAGDLGVGVGTLALALFTAWLALRTSAQVKISKKQMRLTLESIEAADRPFVVVCRNMGVEGVQFSSRSLKFGISNLGKGPAVVEEMLLLSSEGKNLFDEPHEPVRAVAAGERVDLQRTLNEPQPASGTHARFRIHYRSASGAQYSTESTLEVTEDGTCRSRGHRRTPAADSPVKRRGCWLRTGCRRRDSNPRHADYDSAALTS